LESITATATYFIPRIEEVVKKYTSFHLSRVAVVKNNINEIYALILDHDNKNKLAHILVFGGAAILSAIIPLLNTIFLGFEISGAISLILPLIVEILDLEAQNKILAKLTEGIESKNSNLTLNESTSVSTERQNSMINTINYRIALDVLLRSGIVYFASISLSQIDKELFAFFGVAYVCEKMLIGAGSLAAAFHAEKIKNKANSTLLNQYTAISSKKYSRTNKQNIEIIKTNNSYSEHVVKPRYKLNDY